MTIKYGFLLRTFAGKYLFQFVIEIPIQILIIVYRPTLGRLWPRGYPASRSEIVASFKLKPLKWFHGQLLWSFAFNGLTTHRTLYELCS